MLSIIWIGLIVISLIFGAVTGNVQDVTESINIGAKEAIMLAISISGIMCFWSGVMEIMIESKLIEIIAKLLSPLLNLLFKKSYKDQKCKQYISSNFTANLLGLSNAATPMGLKAADRIYDLSGRKSVPKELIMLVVINCSSLQLFPTTVAAIRSNYGAVNSFDILPAVWVTSITSVLSGIFITKIFEKIQKEF